jgi:phosphoribosylpyrophosphate synthetase
MTPQDVKSSYLSSVYVVERRNIIIKYAVTELKKLSQYFDFIVVRGTSGLLVGPEVASRLKKPLGVVRKKTDNSHYCYGYEGTVIGSRYIIIDDFIASGDTVRAIVKEMESVLPDSKCVGVYCYLPKHPEEISQEISLSCTGECKQNSVGVLGPMYKQDPCLDNGWVFGARNKNNKKYGTLLTMDGAVAKMEAAQ